MDKLKKKLKIDETYTRPLPKPKTFVKVYDNIPHKRNWNFMADLLFMPTTTRKKYKYLLVVVDLATNNFDMEPLQNKDPESVLNAFEEMFDRQYIKMPYASIRTDAGTEFKGVFHKYLYDNSILHKVAVPGRHNQLANINALCRQLGGLFNGYMNQKEKELGHRYNDWIDVINDIRADLNDVREKKEGNIFTDIYPVPPVVKPKYKVGDFVYYRLEMPEDALGNPQPTKKFREGDYRWKLVPTKIKKILYYPDPTPIRYILNYKPNVSYAEYELKPAVMDDNEERFIVKQIIDRKKLGNKYYYKIWWKGYLKKDASWEPVDQLYKDGLKEMIFEFDYWHKKFNN